MVLPAPLSCPFPPLQVLDSNMSSYGSPFTNGTSAGAAAVVTTTAAATAACPQGEAAGAAGNTVAVP